MIREGTFYLRVKIKSLADEAKTIRAEARKAKKSLKDLRERWYVCHSLANHRRFEVRSEARAAQLALAFIQGKPYSQAERFCKEAPDWERVKTLAIRYGMRDFGDRFYGPGDYKEREARGKAGDQAVKDAYDAWQNEATDYILHTYGGEGLSQKEAEPHLEGRRARLQAYEAEQLANAEAAKTSIPPAEKDKSERSKHKIPAGEPKGFLARVGSLFT